VVVPAALAAAEQFKADGAQTVLAIAAGIEVMFRLGLISDKFVHKAGFHPTAVLGTFAAAGSTAVIRRLEPAAIVNSLGVAGSMASGIIEYLADGSSTKRLHAGWAAQSGLRAAALGGAGFTGPGTVFEGTHGFFSAFAPAVKPDYALLLDGLGSRWVGSQLAFKPYACGTMAQPYIDCAIALRKQNIRPTTSTVVCAVGEALHRLWSKAETEAAHGYAAKSARPIAWLSRFEGSAGLAVHRREIKDPDILRSPRASAMKSTPRTSIRRTTAGTSSRH
jgi:2-methylcitrate dehydratase PrpD